MGYKLLGMLVWKGGRLYLRRRMDTRRLLLKGGAVLALGGAAALALRHARG